MNTNSISKRTASLALVLILAASGCSSDGESAGSDTTATTSSSVPTPESTVTTESTDSTEASTSTPADGSTIVAGYDLEALAKRIGDSYAAVANVWPGYDPNDHPVVLAVKDDSGTLQGLLAINFPSPAKLGEATELDVAGTSLTSAHLITSLIDADKFQKLSGFDFHFKVADVDSFAMEAGGTDKFFFDPEKKRYVSTLVHEMFHRWQDEGFTGAIGLQDFEGYGYTADNIELAVLEDRALIAGLNATSDADRDSAIQQFAAIRMTRMQADPTVQLDNLQERYEGTARYLEHRLGGDKDGGYGFNLSNYTFEIMPSPPAEGVKSHYAHGRFYASGAAILSLLEQIGVVGVDQKVEEGQSPAEVLIEHLGIPASEVSGLVAEAKTNYDPLGELAASAAKAAETASTEPAVFGDAPTPPSGEGGEDGGIQITTEQFECLEERGLDLTSQDAEMTEEDFKACLETS